MTKLLLDRAIDLDDFIGQIEALDAGTLVGWVHKRDGHCPLEMLAVSPAGHVRGAATGYRPDVLYRQGSFENPGFRINLSSVADQTASDTPVRIFCVANQKQHLAAELTFPTKALVEAREYADVTLNHDRVLAGRFVTADCDGGEIPDLVLENAKGETLRLTPKRAGKASTTADATTEWVIDKQLKLAFIIEALPLKLHHETGDGLHCLASSINVECLFHLTANEDSLSGWAISPDEPARRVLIRMRDADGDVIDESRTILHRSDLARITGLDGFFGFKLPRPRDLNISLEMLHGPETIAGPLTLRWPKSTPEAV